MTVGEEGLSGSKQSKKTLHITNAYHSESGGIKTFYRALLNAGNECEHYVRLIVPGERTEIEDVGKFGRIYHVAAPSSPIFDSRYRLLLPHKYLFNPKADFQRIITDEAPDLVEICDKYCLNWLGGLIRKNRIKGLKRPVLVGFSCERMDDNVGAYLTSRGIGRRLARLYMSYCYLPMFDCHIANSAYTAEELQDAIVSKHNRQVLIHPMGVDYEYFSGAKRSDELRGDLLRQTGGDQHTRLLLYVGRLAHEKNPELLIETVKCLIRDGFNCRMLIAGDGPIASRLKEQAALRTCNNIHFLGHIANREHLATLYGSCDVFVHPNPREPFGITPLEAMAAGLPLVAPNSGGVLSYANDANAWLAVPDGRDFADAVKSVWLDEKILRQKIANARSTAKSFRWSTVASALIRLYQELCDKFREKLPSNELFITEYSQPVNPFTPPISSIND